MIPYNLNRIGHFTQWMFYCAWREARADRIHVLPQVQAELLKGWDIRAIEQSREQRGRELRERNVEWTPGRERHTRVQISWAEQLLNPDSQFHRVRLDAETENRKYALLEELPSEAPRDVGPEDVQTHGDAHLVAEALATGSPLLLARNMKSMNMCVPICRSAPDTGTRVTRRRSAGGNDERKGSPWMPADAAGRCAVPPPLRSNAFSVVCGSQARATPRTQA